jgi:transient receptor potential cation channel subfamily A member 1
MILMPILLMNLLIGLAVGDIESVRRNAQLKRLAMQVVLHTELERKLPQIWLEKIDKTELIEYPNEDKGKLGFFDSLLRKWLCNPFNESGNGENFSQSRLNNFSVDTSLAGLEMVLDSNEDFVTSEMEKQKRKLKDISNLMEQQHQLLRLIVQVRITVNARKIQIQSKIFFLQKMEIKTEADDVDEGVSVKELRPLSAMLSENPSRWNSPRIRKKLRSAMSFNKSLSS